MAQMSASEAVVRVAGGEYTLVLNLGACKRIEQHFNEGINKVFARLGGEDLDLDTLQVVLWAALHKHHNLSLDEVEDMVNIGDLPEWGAKMATLIPQGDAESQDARPQKAKAK